MAIQPPQRFELDDLAHVEREARTIYAPGATPGDVLVVQSDHSLVAAPGGGSQPVNVARVPVASAEVLALLNSPKTLAAGVAGQVIVPFAFTLAYIAGGTPYTLGDPASTLLIAPANYASVQINPYFTQGAANFLDGAASQVSLQQFAGGASGATADLDGFDLELSLTLANVTLGDGTLIVSVSYFMADLA